MKMECDIIRDLLPLYVEQIASEKSGKAIEEHLEECSACKEIYNNMKNPEPCIQYDKEPAESFHKYVKKQRLKVVVVTSVVLLGAVVWIALLLGIACLMMAKISEEAEIYQDTDVSHYQWYMGENAKEEYARKMVGDESIFPEEITEEMVVTDYKMVYYNPWDPQYLSYLVAEYNETAYEAEVERLNAYPSTEYLGYYSVEGFRDEYELLAMKASSDFGFIYALAAGDRQIIYVELLFCNYFYDIDYQDMIPQEYLPVGFDATVENPHRKQKLGR